MIIKELVYVGVNSEDSHVRTSPLPPRPHASGLLETPHSTPKTDKETIVNLYLPDGCQGQLGQTMT
jgi:hypothetical protein